MARKPTETALGLALALAALALGACGAAGNSSLAPAPKNPDAKVTGTLRTFTYDDTIAPNLFDDFKKQNPDLDVQSATFDSDSEAAAKLAGGFRADVVEVCADEIDPLLARNLLRPIDTKGVPAFGKLAFRNAPGIRNAKGQVMFVPLQAGPQGLIVNTKAIPDPPDSWKALFDPRYKGRVALEGDEPLTPIGEAALAMGMKDPMGLSDDEVARVQDYLTSHTDQFRSYTQSDPDTVNLLKSGEVVLSDGGRGTALQAKRAGVPVKWVAPKERPLSWICGLGIPADSANIPGAYKMINYYTSPPTQAQSAKAGYVVTNPAALPLVPAAYKATANPANVANAIPERQPDNFENYVHAWQEVQTR
jgi:spermidine/putrescine transport system substrate-binding protein